MYFCVVRKSIVNPFIVHATARFVSMIGTPGQAWGDSEKAEWREQQMIRRSYAEEVLSQIEPMREIFDVVQYGSLPYDEIRYPLFAVKTRGWDNIRRTVLVTGGVHGYETSGVQGALRFIQTAAARYSSDFNIVVAPCVSPWAYETINRWTPLAVDPNRSFGGEGSTVESSQLIAFVKSLQSEFGAHIVAHFDLHETTDTDETVFSPALAARDGKEFIEDTIPDGFYLVGDTLKPVPEFQKALIEGVSKVTHIAPADGNGCLIGEPIEQVGVINYPLIELGLCASMTGAEYTTTTEVYPDSPKVDVENCILAQVACINAGLDFIRLQQ